MKTLNTAISIISVLLASCATANEIDNKASEDTSFHQCVREAMDLTLGEWQYTAVIARLNGAFRVYETRSIHGKADDDTWTSQSFGGDVENDSISYTRLQGNRWVPVEDGELMTDQALTFISCEGPNDLGWYATISEYQLPPDPVDPEPYFVRASSTYGTEGSYFAEDITTGNGTIVARRSGVTIPAE